MRYYQIYFHLLSLLAFSPSFSDAGSFSLAEKMSVSFSGDFTMFDGKEKQKFFQEVKNGADSIGMFCQQMQWDCDLFPVPRIQIVSSPVYGTKGAALAGRYQPKINLVEVSAKSESVAKTAFHELVHWAHFHSLGEPEWFSKPPADLQWSLEATPFLAMLLNGMSSETGFAEKLYFKNHLAGSLFENIERESWYGLVALWTRYLSYHVSDPLKLLKEMTKLTPDHRSLVYKNYAFRGEEKELLPADQKEFENLFEYFAISLEENASGINPWNLFEVDNTTRFTPITITQSRYSSFLSNATVDLGAYAFFYIAADTLPRNAKLIPGAGLRIVLWRGAAKTPLDLTISPLPNDLGGRDHILIYNPREERGQLSVLIP